MLVATKSEQVGRHGEMKVSTLTIDNPGMMLAHMFDTIYTNKAKIVVQEIACNCRDAHREVGKADVPITIKLPNKLDTSLQFIDEGPGLSPQRIDAIYNSVGASTKRGSNDQTGGFGIGSKTPWSLTNMFLVKTTAWEGEGENRELVYREYTMLREGLFFTCNQTGDPEVKDPALNKSGTIIEMQLEEKEWQNIESEIQKIFISWDPKPNILGYSSGEWVWKTRLDPLFEGKGWKVYNGQAYYNHTHVFMDNIPYPLDWSAMETAFVSLMTDVSIPGTATEEMNDIVINKNNDPMTSARIRTLWHQAAILQNVTCGLFFKTGELDPALNRESLQYTPQTVRRIVARMLAATQIILTTYQKKVEAAPTYVAALTMWKELASNVIRNLISGSRANWRGLPLNTAMTIHFPESVIVNKVMLRSNYSRRAKFSMRQEESIKLEGIDQKKQIFVNTGYNERNVRHYMEQNNFGGNSYDRECLYFLSFKPGFSDRTLPLPDIDAKVMEERFFKSDLWVGLEHGGNSDQFPKRPIIRNSATGSRGPKKDPLAANIWNSGLKKFHASDVMLSVDEEDESEDADQKDIVYVLTFRKDCNEFNGDQLNTLEHALNISIYGVSERLKHRIPDHWVSLGEKAREWLSQQPLDSTIAEYIRKRNINSVMINACKDISASFASIMADPDLEQLVTAPDWIEMARLFKTTFNSETQLDTTPESNILKKIKDVNKVLSNPLTIPDMPEAEETSPEAEALKALVEKYYLVRQAAASYTLDATVLNRIIPDLAIFINAKG